MEHVRLFRHHNPRLPLIFGIVFLPILVIFFSIKSVQASAYGSSLIGPVDVNSPSVTTAAPVANDDWYTSTEDIQLIISAPGVLGNDSDPDTDPITAVLASSPSVGVLNLNSSGAFTYTPNLNFNGIVTYTYHANDGTANSNTAVVTLTITAVNDPPTAVSDTDNTSEDALKSRAAPGVLVNDTDPDTADILVVSTFDAISALNAGVSINPDGGYLYDPTVSALLQTLTPGSSLVDTINYTVSDGNGGSDSSTLTVTVSGINDAPVINNSGNMVLIDINEDDSNPTGDSIRSFLQSDLPDPISDSDAGAVEGIAVIAVNNTNGIWQYSIDNGVNWLNFGAVSNLSAVLLDASGTTSKIRYLPNLNYVGSAGFITFRAWDQTTGTNGATGVNVSNNGGTTAFSQAIESATLNVINVNDAPVLDNSGDLSLTNILEDSTNPPGDRVVSIIASGGGDPITDVDAGALEGVAVIGVDNSNGVWQFSINNGSSWAGLTVAANSATLLNPQARIRYIPDTDYFGTAGNVTFRAWDQTAGVNGQNGVDVTVNGGITPFSLITETASLSILSVNDPPFLDLNGHGGGTSFFATFNEDGPAVVIVDTDLSIVDVDHTTMFSASAAITNLTDGTAELLAATTGGTNITTNYNDLTGVITLTGTDTITNYQTVLRSLAYNNTSQNPTTTARLIEIMVNDGTDDSNVTTSIVTINASNDPPVLETNAGLIVNEGATAVITKLRLNVTDVDNPPDEIIFTLSITPTEGVLKLNGATLEPSDTFSQQDINDSLIDYVHDGGELPSDSFMFTVADGDGGTIGSTAFNITINPDNDDPILVTNDPLVVFEGGLGTISQSLLKVTDADNSQYQILFRVEITPTYGTLKLLGQPLATNDTFTQFDINNNRLTYTHNGSETTSDSFTFAVEDGEGGQIDDTIFDFIINPVNDPPVVDLNGPDPGQDHMATFTEDGGSINITTGTATITDDDDTNLTSLTATLTNRPDGLAEALAVNTGVTTITVNYEGSTGVLTLSGLDSLLNYQTVLRTLTYTNTSQNPNTAVRLVEIVANDGDGDGLPATSSIAIVPLNDPPILDINAGLSIEFAQLEVISPTLLHVSDIDNLPPNLTYTVEAIPSYGVLKRNGIELNLGDTFTQEDIDNNYLSYGHDKTEMPLDSFDFSVNDGNGGGIPTNTFEILIGPKPTVYLPVIYNNYILGEPNDSACQAYEIGLNQEYYFLPDDVEDWYVFELISTSDITVRISNYMPPDGQLLIYTASNCSLVFNHIPGGHRDDISPGASITLNNQPPGTYYVRVYTAVVPSNPTPYTLIVETE